MKNTIENKAKFITQYWGQKICSWYLEGSFGLYTIGLGEWAVLMDKKDYGFENAYLELKPLSMISDEDAIEVIGARECHLRQHNKDLACFGMSPSGIFVDTLDGNGDSYLLSPKDFDYLRLKGYALPFNGLSVEKQIKYGWIKLKSAEKRIKNS